MQRNHPLTAALITRALQRSALVAWTLLSAAAARADEHTFTHTIYLVRHGAYAQNAKADPASGGDLTPLGIAQARLVAARLRTVPQHFDSITSSPLARARETAAIIHDTLTEVPLHESPDVAECSPPTLQTAPTQEQTACAKQLDHVFEERFKPATTSDHNDLIVAHGSVIRYLTMKALGADPRTWNNLFIAHTSITVIEVNQTGAYRVLCVGDIGHIPSNLQSWGTDADPQLSLPR